VKRILVYSCAGVVYGITLNILALVAMGAGHGTIVLFKVGAAPISFIDGGAGLLLSPLYWGGAFSLIACVPIFARVVGRSLLGISYLSVVVWLAMGTAGPSLDEFHAYAGDVSGKALISLFVLVYVIGQCFAWMGRLGRTRGTSSR
jgi:hypothetical protein